MELPLKIHERYLLQMLSTSLIQRQQIISQSILNINSNPCFLLSRSLHLVVNPELQYKTDCTWARPCNNRKYFHSTQVMIFAIR